ncbi:MAG: hypothetical protein WC861_03430 [Candidatus Micrarchaeia archaeon]|jgi:hypothetical protein
MAQTALLGGFYSRGLKAGAEKSLKGLSEKLEAVKGGGKGLEKIRLELGAIRTELSRATRCNELCYLIARLGTAERDLALLEFGGQKKD